MEKKLYEGMAKLELIKGKPMVRIKEGNEIGCRRRIHNFEKDYLNGIFITFDTDNGSIHSYKICQFIEDKSYLLYEINNIDISKLVSNDADLDKYLNQIKEDGYTELYGYMVHCIMTNINLFVHKHKYPTPSIDFETDYVKDFNIIK